MDQDSGPFDMKSVLLSRNIVIQSNADARVYMVVF